MGKGKQPRGKCPSCGRSISGRRRADGRVILRSHARVLKGTRASNWSGSASCPGAGSAVETIPGA